MPDPAAIHIIRSIQKKWTFNTILSYFLVSVAFTVALASVLARFTGISLWWSLPLLLGSLSAIIFINQSWKVSESDVTSFLNQRYPQLEESADLLLKPYESLNLLERMQVTKVAQSITQLPSPVRFHKKLKIPALLLLAVLVVTACLFLLPFKHNLSVDPATITRKSNVAAPEKVLPNISSVQVTITPPLYTGNAVRTQTLFNVKAEEGADIKWRLQTTIAADSVLLLINGSAPLALSPADAGHTVWSIQKNFTTSGYYQLKIDNKLSELYAIDLKKDAVPVVIIQKPTSYTVIDYGQPQQVGMTVSIEDDYGIRNAAISATITTGSGEGVKFREQKISFNNFTAGGRKYSLQKQLDLPALGMKPGDELYFYVSSTDNHNQESRSDVYMISLPDTAQLMSLDGLASGVNVKPEYFRSERQIILETEQLLKDQKTLSAEDYKNKSNDLGVDQKLLRLRYSKFLGEESDGPEAHEHSDEHEHENNAADFGNAEKIMDEVSHKHDNAEDATFFDAQTKKQLKDILDQMWNAELRLRTIKPADALPFEYKALRLLKDLQEKGRSYVAKASFKTTPLKPEKRLSGDLTKIQEPIIKSDFKKKDTPEDGIRRALGILESLKGGSGIEPTSLETLQSAAAQLNRRASAEPSVYLASMGAMNRVLEATGNTGTYSATDLSAAQRGLQKLVGAPAALPGAASKTADQGLSAQYFKNLQKMKR